MYVLHKKDNRYCDALDRLGKLLSHTFDVHCIERPKLREVQVFDNFYTGFENEIGKIKKENPEDTILLNVSSGTPAMKSALQFLAALSDGACIPIQVSSPNKKSNPRRDNIHQYDKELYWICNEDNEENHEDRCSISSTLNLMEKIKKEIIKRHIDVYDYHAALTVAESLNNISEEALDLLKLACNRILLKQSEVDKLRIRFDENIIPIVNGEVRKIVEYLLWLDIKLKRHEYADFIRGITPIVVNLLDLYSEKQLNISIKEYCKRIKPRGNDVYRLTRNELNKTEKGRDVLEILDEHFNPFKDTFYSAAQLTVIINAYSNDTKVNDKVNLLRQAEESVRNIAAHEIIYVDEEFIKKRCEYSTKQIMDALKFLLTAVAPSIPNNIWNSYDDMNNLIKSYI
jgi:CRISPR type III-A/MTUBE-associated protein Csm6